ncbi:unnamed protein product, partial [Ilex paraguariensis]
MAKTRGSSFAALKPRATMKEKGKGKVTQRDGEAEPKEPESRKRQRAIYESTITERVAT